MKNITCFNCGHDDRHGGDGCTHILENGNYCSCAVEQSGVIVAYEIKLDQHEKAIAHLREIAKAICNYRKWNMPNSVALQMQKVREAVASYRAIGVLEHKP